MEDNKLIAEFMQFEHNGDTLLNYVNGNPNLDIEPLEYHTSWDWLMPVVEEIEKLGYDFTASKRRDILVYDANFMDENNIDIVYIENYKDRKEATYQAVVEFIEFYNLHK